MASTPPLPPRAGRHTDTPPPVAPRPPPRVPPRASIRAAPVRPDAQNQAKTAKDTVVDARGRVSVVLMESDPRGHQGRIHLLHRSPPAPPLSAQLPLHPLLAPVHRPQSPPPPQAPLQQNSPPRSIASLGRSTSPRAHNEYVDSPTLHAVRQNQENSKLAAGHVAHVVPPTPVIVPTVTAQPTSSSSLSSGLKKKRKEASATSSPATCQESIICAQCSKCRCRACTAPRELPSRWCGNCEVSCEKMVDALSCVCCIKAAFYHCCPDEDFPSDDPCACCEQAHCCKRWAVMLPLSLCLPCLCMYWPLRCVQSATTSCYDACVRPGCQCHKLPGSKRLLMDSDSSST